MKDNIFVLLAKGPEDHNKGFKANVLAVICRLSNDKAIASLVSSPLIGLFTGIHGIVLGLLTTFLYVCNALTLSVFGQAGKHT